MFSWVVKVVPQPAETLGGHEVVKAATAAEPIKKTAAAAKEPIKKTAAAAEPIKNKEVRAAPVKNGEDVSEDSQNNTGVIGWFSNGFVSALPQPPGTPLINKANSEVRSGENGERSGVIGWVTQGLTKVLPQPDDKYKEVVDSTEEHTEVYEVATMPDFDPLPHIPVVEVMSEDEAPEVESLTPQFPPKVVKWMKQIIPQPTTLPPGAVPAEPPPKASRSSLDKILSPPPESISGISLDTDNKTSGVVDWFVSGLGLKMPQLVVSPKDDAEGATEVLQKGGKALRAP